MSGQSVLNLDVEPLTDTTVIDADVHLSYSSLLEEIAGYMESPYDKYIHPDTAFDPYPTPGWPKEMGGRRGFDLADVTDPATIESQLCDDLGVDHPIINAIAPLDNIFKTDVALAHMRGINDFLLDVFLDDYESFYGVASIAAREPHKAAEEIDRIGSEDQIVGAYIMMGHNNQRPLGDPHYDILYRALEDNGIPPVFHVSNFDGKAPVLHELENVFSTHALSTQWSAMLTLTSLIANGVPEKFPDLDFVLLEASLAWLPGMMAKLNREHGQWTSEVPLLEKSPEQYVRDSFYFGSQPFGELENKTHMEQLIEIIGPESILFSTDYPHYDFDHPNALTEVLRPFSDDARDRVLHRNAAEVFGIQT